MKNNTLGKMVIALLAAVMIVSVGIGSVAAMPISANDPNQTSHLLDGRQYPHLAPQINYFFAEAPSKQDARRGVRFWLNYQIDNVTRAEIFGHVLDNPTQGRVAVYNQSNNWVLWARNDKAWIEANIQVNPQKHTTAVRLSPVSVDSRLATVLVRHPDVVDGDRINLYLNGTQLLRNHKLQGWHTSIPVNLNHGANQLMVQVVSEGKIKGTVAEITVGNVVVGQPVQVTQLLSKGQSEVMQIWAR